MDDHVVDQVAEGGDGVCVKLLVGAGESRGQSFDRGAVALDSLRVQLDDGRLWGLCEFGHEFVALDDQFAQALLDRVERQRGVADGGDVALDLAFDAGQAALQRSALPYGLPGVAHAFLAIGLDVFEDQSRVVELGFQPLDDGAFDSFEVIAVGVGAVAAFARPRAFDAGHRAAPVMHRHAAAAMATAQKPREQPLGPAHIFSRLAGSCAPAQPGLHRLEQFWADQGKMRYIGGSILGWVVEPADPLAGVRVAQHAHPVPDEPTGIELVAQDATAARGAAQNGRSVPGCAPGRQDLVPVEPARDIARAGSAGIFGENALDGLRLVVHDFEHAGLGGHRPVAIGASAGVAAVADHPGHAAANLVFEVGEKQGGDEAANADLDGVGGAVMHGDDFHPGKGQALIDAGQIFLVAREAIEGFYNERLVVPFAGRFHEAEQAVSSEEAGSGAGLVAVLLDDMEPVFGGIFAAERDLVVDRPVFLEIG